MSMVFIRYNAYLEARNYLIVGTLSIRQLSIVSISILFYIYLEHWNKYGRTRYIKVCAQGTGTHAQVKLRVRIHAN
jgi:hypothetical protein